MMITDQRCFISLHVLSYFAQAHKKEHLKIAMVVVPYLNVNPWEEILPTNNDLI